MRCFRTLRWWSLTRWVRHTRAMTRPGRPRARSVPSFPQAKGADKPALAGLLAALSGVLGHDRAPGRGQQWSPGWDR